MKGKNYEVLGYRWFGSTSVSDIAVCVGIAKIRCSSDEIKYKIAACSHEDEVEDVHHIAKFGEKFPSEAGILLLP